MAEKDRMKWEGSVTIYEYADKDGIKIISDDDPYCSALAESPDELRELIMRLEYLGYRLGWLDQEDTEVTPAPTDGWAFVQAGSHWGSKCVWYQVIDGVLVLRDRGKDDNLARNDEAMNFEGLTLKEAYAKAEALNSEPSRQNDGSHLACWSIEVCEVADPADYGAYFLTYQEPTEAEQLRELIQAFLQKKASFADLREAINAI